MITVSAHFRLLARVCIESVLQTDRVYPISNSTVFFKRYIFNGSSQYLCAHCPAKNQIIIDEPPRFAEGQCSLHFQLFEVVMHSVELLLSIL